MSEELNYDNLIYDLFCPNCRYRVDHCDCYDWEEMVAMSNGIICEDCHCPAAFCYCPGSTFKDNGKIEVNKPDTQGKETSLLCQASI